MPTYTGTSTSENLAGTYASDVIVGVGGDDNLVGGNSDDAITGGDGADTIDGGEGLDLVEGGAGADRFVLSVPPLESNRDQIGDFVTGVDRIVILASPEQFANQGTGVLPAGWLRLTTNASSSPANGSEENHFFVYNQDTGTLFYDPDSWGSAAGVAIASLGAGTALVASDIERIRVTNVTGATGVTSDDLQGTAGLDSMFGGAGNDRLFASAGNDTLDGSIGTDVAVYAGTKASYTLRPGGTGSDMMFRVQDNQPTVQGDTGIDLLVRTERVRFDDISVALDVSGTGNAANVAKILGAVFGAAAVDDPRIVGIGLAYADTGNYSMQGLAQLAINARLGPAPTNRAVVELLYTNVTGSAPSESAVQYYTGLVANGSQTQASLGVLAAERPENATRIELVGLAETGLDYTPHTLG